MIHLLLNRILQILQIFQQCLYFFFYGPLYIQTLMHLFDTISTFIHTYVLQKPSETYWSVLELKNRAMNSQETVLGGKPI